MPLCAVPLDPTGSVNVVHFGPSISWGRAFSDSVEPIEPIPLVAPVFHVFLLPIILVSLTTHYLIPPCSCLRHLCVESEGVFRRWRTNSCAASQVVSDTTKSFGTLRLRFSLRQPAGRKLCLFAFRPRDDRNTCSQIRFPSPDMDNQRGWWGRTYAKVLIGEWWCNSKKNTTWVHRAPSVWSRDGAVMALRRAAAKVGRLSSIFILLFKRLPAAPDWLKITFPPLSLVIFLEKWAAIWGGGG